MYGLSLKPLVKVIRTMLSNTWVSKLRWLILMMMPSLLLASCRPGESVNEQIDLTPSPQVVAVTAVTEVNLATPTPTPECTPLPEGMTLSVIPMSSTTAQLNLSGLQPGETLAFVFYTEIDGNSSRIEIPSLPTPVNEKGQLEFLADGLHPLAGATTNHWNIQVVHSRGVACAEVTLP
jgi:hypothetical protein